MTLNLQAKDSYHVFDEFGMCVIPSDQSWEKRSWWKKLWDWILKREWIPTWSNKSWMDSLGRTVLAWIAYKKPEELADATNECIKRDKGQDDNKWILKRHPAHKEKASRDHWSYFIIWWKLYCDKYPRAFKFRITEFSFMRGLYLWMHSLTGNKLAEWFYYTLYIPGALIGNIWLRICRWAGRIGPERSNEWWIDDFVGIPNSEFLKRFKRTRWQKLWGRIISISIPAYALHNKAWQIYVMPDSKRKEKLKRILLKRVGKSNIMLRLLLGGIRKERNVFDNDGELSGTVVENYCGVTQQEVDSYPHMTGYRPGAYLNTTKRTIRELTAQEAEWNTYEKDLIQYLFNEYTGCNAGSGA